MTTDSISHIPPADPVTLLGISPLKRENRTGIQYVGKAVGSEQAETVILVSFDASLYPLEEHCLYALHGDPRRPYTFPNFTFRPRPPGVRVGPWPGWRGIPGMPLTTLKAGGKEYELHFQFWGDEMDRHTVRAVTNISAFHSNEIVVTTADQRIVPIEAEFYAVRPFKPAPFRFDIPAERLLCHPRLLISEEDLSTLREEGAASRSEFLRVIQEFVPRWDRSHVVTPESKIPAGPELLTPEDRLLIGAFLAVIDPTETNTRRGVKSLLDYAVLTEQPGFAPLTIDTQSGETLFLLCVGYDWLFNHLNADDEERIRRRLWEIADICWNHLGYEREDYAQAHYLGCGMGLLAFSLLFRDSHPRGVEWSNHLAGVLKLVLSALPEDGFFPHGINLWIYEFGFLLRWLELLRSSGLNLWPQGPALSNASLFRAAATSPDRMHGVTFGDPQYRVGGDCWCHYLIAARTQSGGARRLGDLLRDLPVDGVDFRNAPARRRVYEFLWFADHIGPIQSRNGITVFPDGAQIFARTPDSLFTFRSGHPLGLRRYEKGIVGGYGHSDPCSGSFLFYEKDFPVITGPGPVYRRDTSLQNLITVDGKGQIGDSAVWMPDFIPPSFRPAKAEIRTEGNAVFVVADLTHSYLRHLGIQSLHRSIAVEPGRYILGSDGIMLVKAANIDWNLHSSGEVIRVNGEGFRFALGGGRWTVLVSCSSRDARSETGLTDFVPAYPNSGARDRFLRIGCHAESAEFHWCICSADNLPELAVRKDHHATWTFRDGTRADSDGRQISVRKQP